MAPRPIFARFRNRQYLERPFKCVLSTVTTPGRGMRGGENEGSVKRRRKNESLVRGQSVGVGSIPAENNGGRFLLESKHLCYQLPVTLRD